MQISKEKEKKRMIIKGEKKNSKEGEAAQKDSRTRSKAASRVL